jgi:hypothetical protein
MNNANFSVLKFSKGNFSGLVDSTVRFPIGWTVRKKLGKPEWSDPLNVYGIYQQRMLKNGKGYIKMKFYTPTNPQTTAQQANRQKFADAMSAWQSLTTEQKGAYNKRARTRGWFGRNLFIREYFQQN